jgi:hypothetical protein
MPASIAATPSGVSIRNGIVPGLLRSVISLRTKPGQTVTMETPVPIMSTRADSSKVIRAALLAE